ncbi:MAG TPA: DUF1573 domain-containing protein [Candidatus Kapabacteria bacterium]|nr:DUF1573 domain-containing protein [Candidatus Kapabacteria bacterium]
MKRLISFLAVLVLASTYMLAGPKLEIEGGNTYDWGNTKPEQSPLKADIKLWNKGDEVLHIKNVKPGCGCTTAPLDTNIIAPGKYATLKVSLNSGSYSGAVTKSISIFTDQADNDHQLLFIKTNVVRPITIFPSYITFNKAEVGHETEASVLVTNNTKEDIKLGHISISDPLVKTNISEGQVLKPNEQTKLEFKVTPDKPGRIDFSVKIDTDCKESPVLSLRGWGNVIDANKK